MKTNIELLNDLNESQQQAVSYVDGPALVIAGAGSGKTRVLTYKIAYLLNLGLESWRCLALTFTNKAAREMKERIVKLVGDEAAAGLWMGTFHSIFYRILRTEADKIGFTPNFTIYDQTDSRNLVKTIIKEMGLDDKKYKPNVVASHISSAKNRLIGAKAYANNSQVRRIDEASDIPQTAEIYERYEARLRLADAMDFDDLLLYTYRLFEAHPEVCSHYGQKFQYVLVDEYQDTNYAQHKIVWQLTHEHKRLCVVGDDAQSIYSFRGANIDNILNFQHVYSGAKVFKLEQNYRSTQTIVGAANSLIQHNNNQIQKQTFSENAKGEPIHLMQAYSDQEEALIVVKKMVNLSRYEHVPFADMAVLYRTNAQSRAFEEALRKNAVPYVVYGGLSFYQRKEIKDVIAYCRLVVNPNDEEAFKRVINYPARGIGQTTVSKLQVAALQHDASLWNVVNNPVDCGVQVNKGTLTKLGSFTQLINELAAEAETLDAAELMVKIVKQTGIMRELMADSSVEGMSRQENIQELLNATVAFAEGRKEEGYSATIAEFLQEVSLLSDQDNEETDEKVTLMTVHAAKGLEFKAVFVVGLEENLFPSSMAGESVRGLEEERRLFYVAITRAEQYCFLSYAKSRFMYGRTEFSQPSRFLREISAKFLDVKGGDDLSTSPFGGAYSGRSPIGSSGSFRDVQQGSASFRNASAASSAASSRLSRVQRPSAASASHNAGLNIQGLTSGDRVLHERFGEGVVTQVNGEGIDARATIQFDNFGQKQLLLRFAKLTKV